MIRILITTLSSILLACPALATSFWISPFGTESGSTQPTLLSDIPSVVHFDTQTTGSIYIWAETDAGETLKNWSLRVKSTDSGVLGFTSSTVYNPELGTSDDVRWEYTIEPTSSSEVSEEFMGFTLTADPDNLGHGIGPGTTDDDSYYYGPNDGSGAWLLAKLDYTIDTAAGATDLFLQIGVLGLNNEGESSSDTTVLFGHTGDTLFADAGTGNRQIDGSNLVDAEVEVLPVPDADFNNDTEVTGADFLIWQRNFGTSSPLNSLGNATYAVDSDVNGIDLAAWQFQYGTTIPLGGSLVGAVAVPEPTTWPLVCLALSGLLTTGRRVLPR